MNIPRNIHAMMKQEAQRKDLFRFKRMNFAFHRNDMAIPGKPYIL